MSLPRRAESVDSRGRGWAAAPPGLPALSRGARLGSWRARVCAARCGLHCCRRSGVLPARGDAGGWEVASLPARGQSSPDPAQPPDSEPRCLGFGNEGSGGRGSCASLGSRSSGGGGLLLLARLSRCPLRLQAAVRPPAAARPPWALDAPQFGPRRVFRELLQKASADRNSKDISGSKQVLTADQALERGKCPKAPSEGVRGEGEKVSRLLGTTFLHTPESRALFLPGAKSWQKRFRNVGRKTLVKGFGGRTRGGTRERRPSARRPRQGLSASGWRLGAVTCAGWGTGEPRARCKAAPRACGPAPGESPPPSWRPASWAHESSSPLPPASPARAPRRPRWFPTSPLSHPGLGAKVAP